MQPEGPAAPSAGEPGLVAQLAELGQLYIDGILSDEAYAAHRARLVAAAPPPTLPASEPPPDASQPGPPPRSPEPHYPARRGLFLAVTAGVLALLTGAVVLTSRHPAVPATASGAAHPSPTARVPSSKPTVKPPTATPAALPVGTPVAGDLGAPITWMSGASGAVALTAMSGGVNLHLAEANSKQWLPIAIAHAMPSLRVDATIDVTEDSAGNRVGLACRTPDQAYGATFSINASGHWYVSIDVGARSVVIDTGHSTAIRPPGTLNRLSAVCSETGHALHLLYAVNGTVVSDDLGPLATKQLFLPSLYLCSCYGSEEMVATHVQVSAIAVSSGVEV